MESLFEVTLLEIPLFAQMGDIEMKKVIGTFGLILAFSTTTAMADATITPTSGGGATITHTTPDENMCSQTNTPPTNTTPLCETLSAPNICKPNIQDITHCEFNFSNTTDPGVSYCFDTTQNKCLSVQRYCFQHTPVKTTSGGFVCESN